MTDHELNSCLMTAITVARRAGARQLELFRWRELPMQTKSSASDVVTQADKDSERIIINGLLSEYPDHSILSEESGAMGGDGDKGLQWVIDPLDGTTNYSQGLPVFSVSIALRENGRTMLGVVFAPYLNELFHATLHGGACLNGHAIHCSDKTDWATAVLCTGMPYDKGSNPDNNLANIARIAPQVRGVRRLGSAALDLCYVGAGFLDGYWEMNLNLWDIAAGELVAREAGAKTGRWRRDRGESVYAATPALAPMLYRRLDH